MANGLSNAPHSYWPSALLVARVRSLAGRRRAVIRMREFFWLLVMAGLGLLLVGWLDLLAPMPPLLRVAGVAAAFLFACGFAVRDSLLLRYRSRPMAIANDVDRLAGARGQVAAGLDLTGLRAESEALTVALARIAVRRAADIAAKVPEERIEPLRTVGRAFMGFGGLLVGVAALVLLWPRALQTEWGRLTDPYGDHPPYSRHVFNVEPGDTSVEYGGSFIVEARVEGAPVERLDLVLLQSGGAEEAMPMFEEREGTWQAQLIDIVEPLVYWVRAPRGRSNRYDVTVIYTPRIESLTVRITPPAYTNRPPTEGPLPQGGIAGLPGTAVDITVASNRPLSRGELYLPRHDGESEPLVAEPDPRTPKSVAWHFSIRQAGSMSLSVIDEAGERSATEISAPILLLEDERPFVRITSPMAESFATPDVSLPVELEAEDDYGVAALSLFRSLNGSRYLSEALMAPVPAEPRLGGRSFLPLKEYGLSPGDVISLFGRVEDTDPAGPKGSESGIVRITIISRETYEEILRARKTADDFAAKYEALARSLEELAFQGEELRKAAEGEQGEGVSSDMQEKLNSFADELASAAEAASRAADQPPLYALDEPLAQSLREAAAALSAAAGAARGAAGAGKPTEMREGLRKALEALRSGRQNYEETVAEPLDRYLQAYRLLEMEQRFIALAERQSGLAERMSDLKGRDGEAEPALRVRMQDLLGEQRALEEELKATLEGIRARAAELPEDPELDRLRSTAVEFADAVQASRALPAMSEAMQGLEAGQGTAAHAGAAEAAEVLQSFIERCKACAGACQCELAFEPTLQEAAAATVEQLLQAARLGMGRPGGTAGTGAAGAGMGRGIGAGAGGYSVRSNTPANVGLYGPANMAQARMSAAGGTADATPGLFWEAGGGGMEGEIGAPERADIPYGGVALQAVPPGHRQRVRDYFRRVAEETSMGTTLEKSAGEEEH